MQSLRSDLFGEVTDIETGKLVCQGSTPQCDRPLAALGDIVAAHGGGAAFVDGEAGTLSDVETPGDVTAGIRKLPFIGEYGASLAGSSRNEGAGERGRSVDGNC